MQAVGSCSPDGPTESMMSILWHPAHAPQLGVDTQSATYSAERSARVAGFTGAAPTPKPPPARGCVSAT